MYRQGQPCCTNHQSIIIPSDAVSVSSLREHHTQTQEECTEKGGKMRGSRKMGRKVCVPGIVEKWHGERVVMGSNAWESHVWKVWGIPTPHAEAGHAAGME